MNKIGTLFLVLCLICASINTVIAEPILPKYVVPLNNNTNVRSETSQTGDNIVLQVGIEDVLQVIGYSYDMESNLWWRVIHTASGRDGYVIAELCNEMADALDAAEVALMITPEPAIAASPEPTSNTESSKAPANTSTSSNWTITELEDKFKMPTGEYSINSIVTGEFSNSATMGSDLVAVIRYDKRKDWGEFVAFGLIEYGSMPVNNPYSDIQYYDIDMMDGSGKESSCNGILFPGDYLIRTDYLGTTANPLEFGNTVLDALRQGGIVRFVVTQRQNKLNTYSFAVDATGFEEAYIEVNNKTE